MRGENREDLLEERKRGLDRTREELDAIFHTDAIQMETIKATHDQIHPILCSLLALIARTGGGKRESESESEGEAERPVFVCELVRGLGWAAYKDQA